MIIKRKKKKKERSSKSLLLKRTDYASVAYYRHRCLIIAYALRRVAIYWFILMENFPVGLSDLLLKC